MVTALGIDPPSAGGGKGNRVKTLHFYAPKLKLKRRKKYEPQYHQPARIRTTKSLVPSLRLMHPNVAEYAESIPLPDHPVLQCTLYGMRKPA